MKLFEPHGDAFRIRLFNLFAVLALSLAVPTVTMAADPDPVDESSVPAPLTGDFKAAIVIDAESGQVLMAFNESDRREPASMLKMMTELIILEHVAEGGISMDETVTVSAKASKMGGSQVYLKQGEEFTVEELLQALAIHSANDAAAALAEHVAGSTDAFVDLMNFNAKKLGMNRTEFHSVHGLPAGRNQLPDLTTAADMAILGRELLKFPEALVWAATETAPFRDGEFTLYNPNKLVGKYRGLDGIKTGYTQPAGFCVTASAVQKGIRLISVVMGCSTDKARATETTRLLSQGFNMFEQVEVFTGAGEPLPEKIKVKGGKAGDVAVTYAATLMVSVPRNLPEGELTIEHRLAEKIEAPIATGQSVGLAVILLDGRELGSVPIVTIQDVAKGNWFNRLMNR